MSELSTPLDDAPRANKQTMNRWPFWAKVLIAGGLMISLATWWLSGAVTQSFEASHRTKCKCQLKQFGLAMHNYHEQYGSFPPAFVRGPDGRKWHSWRVLILPFMEQGPLYEMYRFDEPWDGPNNRKLLAMMPSMYACPSRPCEKHSATLLAIGMLACSDHPNPSVENGFTSYAGVFGRNCVFRGDQPVSMKDMPDGTSNTLLIGECTRTKIPWTKPDDVNIESHPMLGDADGFSAPHEGGVQFSMADGAARFLNLTMAQKTVDALYTRNGGEATDEF